MRTEEGAIYSDMTRWAVEGLAAIMGEYDGRAKVLLALTHEDFVVLVKGISPLLSSDDGAIALASALTVRHLAAEEEGCHRLLNNIPSDELAALVYSLSALLPSPDTEKVRAATVAIRTLLEAEEGTKRLLALMPEGTEVSLVRGMAALLSSADPPTLISAVLSLNALLDEDSGRRRVLDALPEGAFTTLARGVTPLLRSPEEETACSAADALFKLLTLSEGRRHLAAAPQVVTRAIMDGLTRLLSRRSEATTYAAVGAIFNLLTEEEGRVAVLVLPEEVVSALVIALIPLLGGEDGDTVYAAAGTAVRLMLEPEGLRRVLSLSPAALGALVGQLTELLGDAAEPTARAAFEALKRLLEETEGVVRVLAALPDNAAVGELARRITPLLGSRDHARAAAASLSKLLDVEEGRRRVLSALSEQHVGLLVAGLTPLMATRPGGATKPPGAAPSPTDIPPDPEKQRFATAALRNLLCEAIGRQRVINLPEQLFMQLVCEDITLLGNADIETARCAVEVIRNILGEEEGRKRVLATLHEEAWGFSALIRELIPLLGSPDAPTARATAQAVNSLLSEESGRLRVLAQPEVALRGLLRWMTLLLGSPDSDTVRAAALGLGFLLFEGGFQRLLVLPKEALEALVAKLGLVLVSNTGKDDQTALIAASVACGLVVVHDGRARGLALPDDTIAALVAGLTPLLGSAEEATVNDAVTTLGSLVEVQWPRQRVLQLPPDAVAGLVTGISRLLPNNATALEAVLKLLQTDEGYPRVLFPLHPDVASNLVRSLSTASVGRPQVEECVAHALLFLFFHKGFTGEAPAGGLGALLVRGLLGLKTKQDPALQRLMQGAPAPTVKAAVSALIDEMRVEGDAPAAFRSLYALLDRRRDFWKPTSRQLKARLPLPVRRQMLSVLVSEYLGGPSGEALKLVASPGRPLAAQACEAVLASPPQQLLAGVAVDGWVIEGAMEAVSLMAEEIAGESSGLFKAIPAERCMHPRGAASPEHLPLFRLLGRLLGLSLFRCTALPIRLSPLFYKLLMPAEEDAETIGLEDLKYCDAAVYKALMELLQKPLKDQGLEGKLFFVDEIAEAGDTTAVALVPGGRGIQVTDANKAVYASLKTVSRIRRTTDVAIRAALKQGIYEFVPPQLLDSTLFDATELQSILEVGK